MKPRDLTQVEVGDMIEFTIHNSSNNGTNFGIIRSFNIVTVAANPSINPSIILIQCCMDFTDKVSSAGNEHFTLWDDKLLNNYGPISFAELFELYPDVVIRAPFTFKRAGIL